MLMVGSGIVFPLVFAGELATGDSEEEKLKSAAQAVTVEYLVRFALVEAALFTNLVVLMLDLQHRYTGYRRIGNPHLPVSLSDPIEIHWLGRKTSWLKQPSTSSSDAA